MAEYKGTHGTAKSCADKINTNGFVPSKTGKRGSGVYFWSYQDDKYKGIAKELAIGWWGFALKKGSYSKIDKKSCCVIYVTIESEHHIDLEQQEVKERFICYYNKVKDALERDEPDHEVLTSRVYDMFLLELEKSLAISLDSIHVKVQPPKKHKANIPFDILGHPSCYIVKNESCIQLDQIEEIIQ